MNTTPLSVSVLVVDDDLDTAESLAELLTLHGFAARSAHSADEAFQSANIDPPDVVVLDVWMPSIGGWELASRLSRLAKPPVLIALTGCGSEDDRRRSAEVGIHVHLVKPVDPAAFLHVLRGLTSGHSSGHNGDEIPK